MQSIDWAAAAVELQKPLDPKAIRPPPPGKFGEYVDGLHVIRAANRIFGEGGWSYEIIRLTESSHHVFDLTDKGGAPYKQVRVSYLCTVRLTVGGVIREGAAVGTGNGKPENIGDVIESAVKEAETDALKRAFRAFGNTFGLALYEKDKSKREVAEPFDAPATRDRIKAAIAKAGSQAKLDALWTHQITVDAFGKLPAPMQGELTKAYTDRMGGLVETA